MQYSQNFPGTVYQVIKQLGQNRAGGRMTYLAVDTRTEQQVVIKQFQFAKPDSTWSVYDIYEREMQILQGLDHPGIPRYLESFQHQDGFCMVQEYKPALSLGIARSFSPHQIRQIAIAALNILVYLQNRIPPIIHRDLKPENILVDEAMNVYLVDFGFARIGEGEVGESSVVKGTLGFMPPEQLFNRQLTEASDLYGLGMTLICLITNTPSGEIGQLIDVNYQISFRHLAQKISLHWVRWLEKMVEPILKNRFANAIEALQKIPGELILPKAVLNTCKLNLVAHVSQPLLTQTVTVHNAIPETCLEGWWEIAPHLSDPPHTPDKHAWITCQPQKFAANQVDCQVSVDTSKLLPNKTYSRQLLLHSNDAAKTYSIELQIQTPTISCRRPQIPYLLLLLNTGFCFLITWMMSWLAILLPAVTGRSTALTLLDIALVTAPSAAVGFWVAAWIFSTAGARRGSLASVVVCCLSVLVSMLVVWMVPSPILLNHMSHLTIAIALIGVLSGLFIGIEIGVGVESLNQQGYPLDSAIAFSVLSVGVGISLGLGYLTHFSNPIVLLSLGGTGFLLLVKMLHTGLTGLNLRAQQREMEKYLIKP